MRLEGPNLVGTIVIFTEAIVTHFGVASGWKWDFANEPRRRYERGMANAISAPPTNDDSAGLKYHRCGCQRTLETPRISGRRHRRQEETWAKRSAGRKSFDLKDEDKETLLTYDGCIYCVYVLHGCRSWTGNKMEFMIKSIYEVFRTIVYKWSTGRLFYWRIAKLKLWIKYRYYGIIL